MTVAPEPTLVALAPRHQGALDAFLTDFDNAGETTIPAFFCPRDWSHERKISTLEGWSRGEGVAPGFVASTTRFLEVGDAIAGVINLRHELNQRLRDYGGHVGFSVAPSHRRRGYATLMLGTIKAIAQDLGLSRLLVTCEPHNRGSYRAITANGGVFYDQRFYEPEQREVCRFWIDL